MGRREGVLIFFLAVWATLIGTSTPARAMQQDKPMHWTAKKQFWDREKNRVELFGDAVVRQPGETFFADTMVLDQSARTVEGKGNCIYITPDAVVYGEEMQFNLDTRTGTIRQGLINSQGFSLSGEQLHKLSDSRFMTHWGEYSTCRDCPRSWSLNAEDVDLEIDGYARMSNVVTKIKDAPAFWMPYLIVPIKTHRQSGLLFPKFRISDYDGFVYVQPYFWAINRSSDMTFSLGTFTNRGRRAEWEGRYQLTERSAGRANLYSLHDEKYPLRRERWSMDVAQMQELHFGVDQRLRFLELSDNLYTRQVGDLAGMGTEPYLKSEFSLSKPTDEFTVFMAAQRYRSLINLDPDQHERELGVDPKTVQVFPLVKLTTNDRFLFDSPFSLGMNVALANFTRSAGSFDYDEREASPTSYVAGRDPIRKATRVTMTPSAYTILRPFDEFSFIPSAQLRTFYYHFPDVAGKAVPDLTRGYLLLQGDLSTQLERIYDWPDDPETPRTKHLIRPMLTYSLIPNQFEYWSGDRQTNHPFLNQIQTRKGYIFDQNDLVPLDVNPETEKYTVPLGHSLAYGFRSQLVSKNVASEYGDPSYATNIEFSAGQSLSFRELKKSQHDAGNKRRLFSRAFSSLAFNYEKFSSSTFHYYYPYTVRYHHTVSHDTTYTFAHAVHQRVLQYERSISGGFSWDQTDAVSASGGTKVIRGRVTFSINDYLLPSLSTTWDVLQNRVAGVTLNTLFQSPSVCWRFGITVAKLSPDRPWERTYDLSLNLTGSGFGGVSEASNTVQSR